MPNLTCWEVEVCRSISSTRLPLEKHQRQLRKNMQVVMMLVSIENRKCVTKANSLIQDQKLFSSPGRYNSHKGRKWHGPDLHAWQRLHPNGRPYIATVFSPSLSWFYASQKVVAPLSSIPPPIRNWGHTWPLKHHWCGTGKGNQSASCREFPRGIGLCQREHL